jgi:signal transduction histidine kinase
VKRKFIIYLLLSIITTAVLITGLLTVYARFQLQDLFENDRQETLVQVKQRLIYFDRYLLLLEEEMNEHAEKALKNIRQKLVRNGNVRQNVRRDFLKKLVRENKISHIYLINPKGVIYQTTYGTDMDLDLSGVPEIRNILEKIRGTGEIHHRRIYVAERSGIKNKYSFFSPKGGESGISISLNVREYIQNRFSSRDARLLFQDFFSSIAESNKYLDEIDIYSRSSKKKWSFIHEGKRLAPEIEKMIVKQDPYIVNKEDGTYYYTTLDLKESPYNFANHVFVEMRFSLKMFDAYTRNLILAAIGLSFIIAVLSFLVSSRVFRKTFIDRILAINDKIRLIGSGYYHTTIEVGEGDEIGEIAGNIQKMAHAIESRENEIKKAAAKIEKINRIKDQFISNVNHELRTPMTGIMGMIQLLLDSELDEEQRQYAEIIKISSDALLRVVKNILDFSDLRAGLMVLEKEKFNLEKSVRKVFDNFKIQAQSKQLTAELNFSGNVPEEVMGYPHQVKQILIHLLDNAVKFTEKGKIGLRVEMEEREDPLFLYIRFTIRDTGIGIARENFDKLFEHFNQVDYSDTRQYGGLGLGLAIVNELVDLLKGSLEVKSEIERGSRFIVTIPFEPVRTIPRITPPTGK